LYRQSSSNSPSVISRCAAASLAGKACVVLGAGGFLGRHLCIQLANQGAHVRAFGRNLETLSLTTSASLFQGEFSNAPLLSAAICSADIVFHLISTTTPATAEKNRAFDADTNVTGALRLIEMCKKHGVSRIVFASSGGTIYGQRDEPCSELHIPSPLCAYGNTKLSIERYLATENATHGMQNISLRIANAFGPQQRSEHNQGVIGIFLRAMLRSQPVNIWGDGKIVRDYIDVDSVTDAFVRAAMYQGNHATFNIGTGVGRSLNGLISDLEDVTGLIAKRTFLPGRTFDVETNILDSSLAREELKWAPNPNWRECLLRTLAWITNDVRIRG
jgi:UDP-glucose 4-epimerase